MGIEAIPGPHGLDTIAALPLYPTTRSSKDESHVVLANRTATQQTRYQQAREMHCPCLAGNFVPRPRGWKAWRSTNLSLADWTQGRFPPSTMSWRALEFPRHHLVFAVLPSGDTQHETWEHKRGRKVQGNGLGGKEHSETSVEKV